ncbi:MAG: hypothetical protein ACYC3L_00725 [Gemmatimonadaceae bacterium]
MTRDERTYCDSLTPGEAELVAAWSGIPRAEPVHRGIPWFSAVAGACLWAVAIVAILIGLWVVGA